MMQFHEKDGEATKSAHPGKFIQVETIYSTFLTWWSILKTESRNQEEIQLAAHTDRTRESLIVEI